MWLRVGDLGTGRARLGRSVGRSTHAEPNLNPHCIMKDSTHDRIEGRAKQVRGKAKLAAGKVMGKSRLKAKGRADIVEGKIQKKIGDRERAKGR